MENNDCRVQPGFFLEMNAYYREDGNHFVTEAGNRYANKPAGMIMQFDSKEELWEFWHKVMDLAKR